ncbi:proto-oncogene tyrosine-protein kinase ROS [Galendromus occidentalis]|uniref:Tyrosine-protein kinase receptor n=1 Tax=Galendromus occidentalis TaxID=34638 RepID=A0AAJ7SHU2_9ACAR|nr:proto-oncogene tyrosine-protein kinase ROS [Galendromus occidentalis]
MRGKSLCLVVLAVAVARGQDSANFNKCVQSCQQANNEELNEVCDKECQSSCTEGCQSWRKALGSDCAAVCAFRLAWTVSTQFESLFTVASTVKTSEFGPPQGAPQKVTCALTTHNQVAVSWRPPAYPASAQISYLLETRDDQGNPPLVHELTTNSSDDQIVGYVFRALEPSRKYRVQVQASNRHGKSEMAFCEVKTAEPELNVDEGQAFAASGRHLYKFVLGKASGWGDVVFTLPDDDSVITGIASNLQSRILYISDGKRVYVVDMDRTDLSLIPKVLPIDAGRPSLLSYDWLNKRLFLFEEMSWQIRSCNIERDFRCTSVVHGFDKMSSPTKVIVDPYNGFLFWMNDDPVTAENVVYRADLILAEEDNALHWRKAEEVHRAKNIRSFEIDFVRFRLYALDIGTESIYSMDIDSGKNIENVRNQWSFYGNASDMVYANDHFHLATSDGFYEETRAANDRTYATYSRCNNHTVFRLAVVDHRSAQPVPSPATPVENVRALFSVDSVRVLWDAPHPFKWQGRGVFQKFLYAVDVTELLSGKQFEPEGNFKNRQATIKALKSNTLYSIKVRAYNHLGAPGPESAPFVGRTFSESPLQLAWSLTGSERTVVASDVMGDHVSQLVSPRLVQDSDVNAIAWYENTLFLGRNRSSLIRVDFNQGSSSEIPSVTGVTCMAIERYAQKIYWGSLDKRAIFRCNFDGSHIERVVQNFVPHSIAVDSARGFLVWADQYGVYTSKLSGESLRVIYQNHVNSGRLVQGVAYDSKLGVAYWTSRSIEGVHVRSDRLMEEKYPLPPAVPLLDSSLKGPAMYLDGRLLWFDGRLQPVVTLPNGSYPAHFDFQSSSRRNTRQHEDFTETLAVAQQIRQNNKMMVIPRNIDVNEIKVRGSWQNFTIYWPKEQSTQVDVFYKLRISACEENQSQCCSMQLAKPVHILTNERFLFTGSLRPYTKLAISLQAYTHWASTESVCREVRSPESIPTAPQNPKVFIAHRTTFPPSNDSSPEAEFRWSEPEHPNGKILGYVLNCWYQNNGTGEISVWKDRRVVGQSFSITSLVPNSTYFFKVSAFTSAGEGPASPPLSINSDEEQPVPRLIVVDRHSVQVSDVDNGNVTLVSNKVKNPVGIAYLDKTVFWLEQNGPIMASDMDGSNITVIHSPKKTGTCLTIDWVARKLYWAEYDVDASVSKISALDLGNGKSVTTILELPKQHVNSLEADPFTSTLIYTISRTPREAAAIMLASIDGSNQRPLFPPRRRRASNCQCSARALKASVVALDPKSKKAPGYVYFADAETGNIWSADLHGCACTLVANASLVEGLPPDYITVDKQRVYWSQQGREEVFSLLKESSEIGSAKIAHGVRNIRALNQQRYPDSSCMEIGAPTTAPALVIDKSASLQVEVFPPDIAEHCSNISRPTIRYVLVYKRTGCLSSAEICQQKKVSDSATPVIEGLTPNTNYTVTYSYIDPYTQALHGPSSPSIFSTDDGAPEPVKNLKAVPLTPSSIGIRWATESSRTKRPPQFELRYSEVNSTHPHNVTVIPNKRFGTDFSRTIEDLKWNTTYRFEVIAINSDKPGMRSGPSTVLGRTFESPSDLRAVNVSSRQMELKWKSGKQGQSRHSLEYSLDGVKWDHVRDNRSSQDTRPDHEHIFRISDLQPNQKYWFRLHISYLSSEGAVMNHFVWPPVDSGKSFVFHTLEEAPSPPGSPTFQVNSNLSWESPEQPNGNGPLHYELQYRTVDNHTTSAWAELYRGPNNHFQGSGLSLEKLYEFRVRASNSAGHSAWSQSDSLRIPDVPVAYSKDQPSFESIVTVVFVCVLLLIVSGAIVIHKLLQPKTKTTNPDIGLVRIDRFPVCQNFVHQHNELYFCGVTLSDPELSSLPMIQRDQIRLTKFLGSGAFGEVFEGVLYGDTAQKIAVKTLRKGAGEMEKHEFLKEAKLMSNFRHPHILQLLGISFDDDMSFIVMELMDGGDLLSVLRNCRNKVRGEPSLSLEDLIGICVDIAKGCKYLEEMRFVHRDLAARNCLVSTDGDRRVVKIGDFGLARDVYKSDYYRKEGEGLLPVRWMAPEALVDGVFTNCSDVWAFGVLMWEVMSLGHQPYQAMSNYDVLNFVRGGGLLACTVGCPAEMYELMLCCWRYNPEERPKFYHIVASLENLVNAANSLTVYMPPTQQNYIIPSGQQNKPLESPRLTSVPLLSIGIDNFAYEPSSVTSSASSVLSFPPGLSSYSRARSLDTITEVDDVRKIYSQRYAWLDHNVVTSALVKSDEMEKTAKLQRVLEEESKSSSCSDLSAINSDESKDIWV